MMVFESSLIPIPSEITIIPAGVLASRGDMNILMVILIGTTGNMLGATFNYFFAHKVGRKFLLKYGQYFFVTDKTIHKMEEFFSQHGEISIFTARLIPGLRQYISLQAGISNMNYKKFAIFTIAGAGLWVIILAVLGFAFGENEELISDYLDQITIALLVAIPVLIAGYVAYKKNKTKAQNM